VVKDVTRWKNRIKHLLYRHGEKYPEKFAAWKAISTDLALARVMQKLLPDGRE
jgi:hypothetical protein